MITATSVRRFTKAVTFSPVGAESLGQCKETTISPPCIHSFPLYPFSCLHIKHLNTSTAFLSARAITSRQVG